MSEIIEAIVLGIVQGLTEFLPVSSSGHLEIAKAILGDTSLAEESLVMTVTLHAATAIATMIVFWKDIKTIFIGSLNSDGTIHRSYIAKIVVSMIPAVFVGLFFEDLIESLFNRNLLLVAAMLIVTGLLLFIADKAKDRNRKVSFKDALIIGLSQAVAILPGISRSGATISTSVLLGIDREAAARFSFLMVIPLILGKMAKDVLDGSMHQYSEGILALSLGFIAALFTGMFACTLMIKLVKQSKLKYFSFYCFAVALSIFGFLVFS